MTPKTYFEELSYALRRKELLPRATEEDGLLPVEWNGRPLCRITESGAVRYDPTWVVTDQAKVALAEAAKAAGTVMEYMDFGRFNPQHALKQAQKYGQEREISTSQAMACFTMDQPEFAAEPGGPRCILNGLDSELTDALFQISLTCPAVAAHITCNADLSITEIAYHPLWLERSRSLAPMQQQM